MSQNFYKWLVRLVILLLVIMALLPVVPVSADVGPKPGMTFKFSYKISPVEIVKGTLIECEDPECKVSAPLKELGPQRLTCSASECSAIAYGFSDYHKLVIQFTDRTRESNIFSRKAYNANFTVTVTEDKLAVKENSFFGCYCPPAALITIFIEMLIASLYLSAFGLPRLVLGWVPLASLVTLPFVWAFFPLLIVPGLILMAVSEVFAVGVETVFLHHATGRMLNYRHAFILSILMNAASFAVGLLVLV